MVEPLAPAALADDLLLLDGIPDLEGGEWEGEEEELEWLSNKDAFPSLETSFEVSGTGAETEASPVSVLAAAAPPLRVPVRARSERPRRRRRRALPVFSPAKRLPGGERRRCLHCEAEDTPQWRAGPEGPKTLCNACGVRFKSGRLVPEYRPASSPTFSAFLHSNSHRRIMEMRRGGGSAAPRRRRGAAADRP